MDKPWKVIIAFVGIFLAGAAFGGFFTLRASSNRFTNALKDLRPANPPTTQAVAPKLPRPNPLTPQLMRIFTRRLTDLSPDQRRRLTPHVERAAEDLQRLRQQHFADTQRVTERMYADVSEILTPEQRAEIENMRRQMEERLQAEQEKRKKMENFPPDVMGKEKKGQRGPGEQ